MVFNIKQRLTTLESQVQARLASGGRDFGLQSASRKAQLLAALLLPFFVITCFAASTVVKEVVVDFVPDTFPALSIVAFLVGTGLIIASCAAAFAWVKTGGFGLFD